MNKDIEKFADKYIDFFEKEFGRTRESYYRFFDNNDFPYATLVQYMTYRKNGEIVPGLFLELRG